MIPTKARTASRLEWQKGSTGGASRPRNHAWESVHTWPTGPNRSSDKKNERFDELGQIYLDTVSHAPRRQALDWVREPKNPALISKKVDVNLTGASSLRSMSRRLAARNASNFTAGIFDEFPFELTAEIWDEVIARSVPQKHDRQH